MSTTLALGPVTLRLPLVAREDDEQPVCFISSPTHDDTEIIAIVPNPCVAHLFAAGPDLLVAAEALVASSSGMHRGICNANHVGPLGGGGCSCPMGREFRALRTAIARARGAA